MVGVGVAVADAVDEVREQADIVLRKGGGQGAIRETIETILTAQQRWDSLIQRYLTS